MQRRRYLGLMGVAVLAGCLEIGGEADDGTEDERPPDTAFQFSYNGNENTVTVSHAGGPSIPATQLEVTGENIYPTGRLTEFGVSELSDGEFTVGDEFQVAVGDAEYNLTLLWHGGNQRRHPIATDHGPTA